MVSILHYFYSKLLLTIVPVARDLAEKAGVPIVPGTKGLVESPDEAAQESERLGFPVMLKGMSQPRTL